MNMQEAFDETKRLVGNESVCVGIDLWHHKKSGPETKCHISAFIPDCRIFYGNNFDTCIAKLRAELSPAENQALPTNEEAGITEAPHDIRG